LARPSKGNRVNIPEPVRVLESLLQEINESYCFISLIPN
jgi:hypothetical protein